MDDIKKGLTKGKQPFWEGANAPWWEEHQTAPWFLLGEGRRARRALHSDFFQQG
jgi:hypothetical protein